METLGELLHTLHLTVSDTSHIADARRQVAALTHYGDFSENDHGRIALIVTELATNILKHAAANTNDSSRTTAHDTRTTNHEPRTTNHEPRSANRASAGSGSILVQHIAAAPEFAFIDGRFQQTNDTIGIDIIAIDKGPGIRDTHAAMEDGFSTAGSAGTGLGAIVRQSDAFNIYSFPGKGTVVHARVISSNATGTNHESRSTNHGPRSTSHESRSTNHEPDALSVAALSVDALSVAAINIPYKGEPVSGDSWACRPSQNGIAFMLADGIGHGQEAHDASRAATELFTDADSNKPAELLADIHHALTASRGAAASVAFWDLQQHQINFCGIGNVAGAIALQQHHAWPSNHEPQTTNSAGRKLMTFNGTLGHNLGKFHELNYPASNDAILVLHSDGLTANWTLDALPGAERCTPIIIAALLWRDYARGRDDASIVVAK